MLERVGVSVVISGRDKIPLNEREDDSLASIEASDTISPARYGM
jgi:hypothetical protein